MTLEELLAKGRADAKAKSDAFNAEVARRQRLIAARLHSIGITPRDGWVITAEGANIHGVTVTHPELPHTARLLWAGDGSDQMFLFHGTSSQPVESAWEIAHEMGATLDKQPDDELPF